MQEDRVEEQRKIIAAVVRKSSLKDFHYNMIALALARVQHFAGNEKRSEMIDEFSLEKLGFWKYGEDEK